MTGYGGPLSSQIRRDVQPEDISFEIVARTDHGPGPDGVGEEPRPPRRAPHGFGGDAEGRLVVAMGIVDPCHEDRAWIDRGDARLESRDKNLGALSLLAERAVDLVPKIDTMRRHAEARAGRARLPSPQGREHGGGMALGAGMGAGSVGQNVNEHRHWSAHGLLDKAAAANTFIIGMRRQDEDRAVECERLDGDDRGRSPSVVVRPHRLGCVTHHVERHRLINIRPPEGTAEDSAGCRAMNVMRDLPGPSAVPLGNPREAARIVANKAIDNASRLDQDGAFPHDEVAQLHRLGLLHAPFAASMGGREALTSDPVLLAEVLGALGYGSLPLARLYEGHANAVKLVQIYGSKANLALLRAEADAGRLTGVWMAEDGTPLRLEQERERSVLKGRKVLASGASFIRRPLVAAACAAGSRMILPLVDDISRADLSGWTAQGMKASATGTVDFTGISVADDEFVGQPGDYLRSPFFRGGAWRVLAVQLGGLQALLDSYRSQIVAVGRGDDRLQRSRFGDAAAAVETARLWVREAGSRAEDRNGDPAAIDAYVDLARGAFEQAALVVIDRAQRSLGLKAFMKPNPSERIIRDLTTYLRQPALDASRESAAAFFFNHGRAHND